VAQVKSVGYAINGITESHLYQYRHLGDAVNKTDNQVDHSVHNPRIESLRTDDRAGSTFDDRFAFTNRSSSINYGTAISLAAASRALKGYNDRLSEECLAVAQQIWKDEHSHEPDFRSWGKHIETKESLAPIELRAAFELWRTTGNSIYKARVDELLPAIEQQFDRNVSLIAQIVPYMDESFKQHIAPLVKTYAGQLAEFDKLNPYGVLISTGGWAGNSGIIQMAITCYLLHQSFPELIDREYALKGLNYIYGCHPDSDISFVSAVGASSKKVAYGNNRANFSFIAGGVVPGVRILKTDFPENRSDYPFIWSENEYVIDIAAEYIFLVNAVNELLN
jgi:hypothetical protein